jgi:hypothetical protein
MRTKLYTIYLRFYLKVTHVLKKKNIVYNLVCSFNETVSDSARHQSKDIFPPTSQIVLNNFIKMCLIIKECPEEIFIKLTIVWKISMSSWNTVNILESHKKVFESKQIKESK